MALLYSVSDADLAKGKFLKPESEAARPNKSMPSSRERVRLHRRVWESRTTGNTIGQEIEQFCVLVPLSIAVCGVGVLAYQVFHWLREGYWKPLQARLVLGEVLPAGFLHWARSGDSWLGLNDITSFVLNSPLVLFLLIFSLVLRLLIAKTFGMFSERAGTRKKNWRC